MVIVDAPFVADGSAQPALGACSDVVDCCLMPGREGSLHSHIKSVSIRANIKISLSIGIE